MFPKADIPVIQLSINALEPFAYHLELGRRLAPLRRQGVLILASGNVVHNLRRVAWNDPLAAFDWARRFDAEVAAIMTTNPAGIADIARHPDFALAAPTPEHFLPLLYLAGLAEAEGKPASIVTEGYTMGSLSMTAYALDYAPRTAAAGSGGPATAASLPPDQTNM